MRRAILNGLLILALAGCAAGVEAHHDLAVRLAPAAGTLAVNDTVVFPATGADSVRFLLHDGLNPRSETLGYALRRLERSPRPGDFPALPAGWRFPTDVPVALYELSRTLETSAEWRFTLVYEGPIRHPVTQAAAEYARGFGETPGIIAAEGAYLAGGSYWVPWFGPELITFFLAVEVPAGWDAVSQGRRIRHEREGAARHATWECPHPSEEIHLVAGPFTEYSRPAGPAVAMAFLRTPDPALADRYLGVTASYMDMYQKLIGPFPYEKFALVENCWETGYGMPSFTLLGEKVIRFPFILHSSYPHELLHNYWGNGVYVDMAAGNWCEGLTAYLADHLIAEQRGQGEEYRRATLQKYADYVNATNDFPLTAFRSRHDAASEAVGYGKSMMLFHMLRRDIGDAAFTEALRSFYRDNRYRRATFADFARAAGAAAGRDLQPFFDQWVTRAGAPVLRLVSAAAAPAGGGWRLAFRLAQAPDGAPFALDVPVAVTLEGEASPWRVTVPLPTAGADFELDVPRRPLRLDVDPQFDLFRRLDRAEIPPALSRAFGAGKVWLVLPSAAPPEALAGYRRLAEGWAAERPGQMTVVIDKKLSKLPRGGAVWLLGWENTFRPTFERAAAGYGLKLGTADAAFGDQSLARTGHSVVVTARHPDDPAGVLVWLGADPPAALPGLGRKLPHYGKYSYLAFEGDEPANVLKGQWPAVGSPLSAAVVTTDSAAPVLPPPARLPARKALAELPPPFSAAAMMEHVRTLAAPELEGRGLGSPGLTRAADYIAGRFQAAGLRPGGDGGGWLQRWTEAGGPDNLPMELANVVAVLPGARPDWVGQSVVVCAHYDHLGLGWPDVHQGDEGKIHPGADDNASGVAVMLELARVMAQEAPPERTVIFAAFTGEESGRRGSRHYLAVPGACPPERIMGAVNLDTVGRLGERKLLVLGGASAREWVHIAMGCSYVTGVASELVGQELDSSDQVSFIARNIPAVQLFAGPHADYHRPGDTADRVDAGGLVKVAAFAREAVRYLAERAEPLTRPAPAAASPAAAAPARGNDGPVAPSAGRRVTLGTMPDFAFAGPGVKVAAVTPDSPAAGAGIRPGDVITALDGQAVTSLAEYAAALRARQPGDTVTVTLRRDGTELSVAVTLVAR